MKISRGDAPPIFIPKKIIIEIETDAEWRALKFFSQSSFNISDPWYGLARGEQMDLLSFAQELLRGFKTITEEQ